MSDTLQVEKREARGSRASRRLRAEGKLPAILYGHKEDAVSLSVSDKQLRKALQHNAKVVDLAGAASGQAIVQDLQWDTFHVDLLHVDLLRVDAGEKVHVTIPLELKGEAIGSRSGGVVEQTLSALEIEAAPASIPEVLHVEIDALDVGGTLSANQITDLPEGAKLLTPGETVVARCTTAAGEPDLEAVAAKPGDPEVVGKGGENTEEA